MKKQNQYIEEELEKQRDLRQSEVSEIKETVTEQDKIIAKNRADYKREKEELHERIFDLEEALQGKNE